MLLSKNFRVISDSLLCFGCLLVYPHFLSGYLSINLLDFRYFQDFLSVFGFQGTGFFGFLLSVSFQLPSSGDGEIRTLDPLLARQVLSQLSYTPTKIWHPPALPCRLQHSTIGRLRLNRRVRDGYGCFPQPHRHQISFTLNSPFGSLKAQQYIKPLLLLP